MSEEKVFDGYSLVDFQEEILAYSKQLEGKMLTVFDASFSDEVQREAMKDILRRELKEMRNAIYKLTCTTTAKYWSIAQGGNIE